MINISQNESEKVVGGVSVTGAIVNALTNLAKYVYTLGQSLGSSLRRLVSRKTCNCK